MYFLAIFLFLCRLPVVPFVARYTDLVPIFLALLETNARRLGNSQEKRSQLTVIQKITQKSKVSSDSLILFNELLPEKRCD